MKYHNRHTGTTTSQVSATRWSATTHRDDDVGYGIVGKDGLTVSEKWANGLATFHGMHSRGFVDQLLNDDEVRIQHYHDWMDHHMGKR